MDAKKRRELVEQISHPKIIKRMPNLTEEGQKIDKNIVLPYFILFRNLVDEKNGAFDFRPLILGKGRGSVIIGDRGMNEEGVNFDSGQEYTVILDDDTPLVAATLFPADHLTRHRCQSIYLKRKDKSKREL